MSRAVSVISNITDRLLGFMNGRLAATPEPIMPAVDMGQSRLGSIEFGLMDAYYRMLEKPGERRAEMKLYDYLEVESPDVPKALDAFATMACTGTMSGASEGSFTVELDADAPEGAKNWAKQYERVMQVEAYSLIRGMAKYGSYPVQLITGERAQGIRKATAVVDFNHLPPGTMFRNLSGGPEKYWLQKFTDHSQAIDYERWRVPHFAIWSNVVSAENTLLYGRSMLQPVARLAMQLSSCEDAMVIARLTRAAMRYVFEIDISDVSSDEKKMANRLKWAEEVFGRQRQQYAGGARDSYQRPPVPDGDFYMATGKNLAYKVTKLEGDANLSNIKDVEFLLRRYFGAIGVPLAYVGQQQERGGGRSNLSQVDIHFARSSRYLQLFACGAFLHGLAVHMILGGYDPELYNMRIVPPSIGARDELLHAQVRMLQSQVVANLVKAGMDITAAPRWTLQTLMNMGPELDGLSDAEMEKLFKLVPTLQPQASTIRRPERANADVLAALSEGSLAYVENIRALLRLDMMPSEESFSRQHPRQGELLAGILSAR